jgi:membrane protease YdiL (CAAX protease family)
MFKNMGDLAKSATFYVIALVLCVGAILLVPRFGDGAFKLVMFTPLLAVLVMLLVVTRDGASLAAWRTLGLHRLGVKGWALALFVPLFVLGVAYGAVWLSGVASFVPPARFDIVDLVASIVIVTLMGGFGEEIGWRGYLLPHLRKLGLRTALVISGFLHGAFHLPAILGTNLYHSDGDPLIVVPLFLATLTMAGICYGYLRLTTGSVWPAALAHSAFNIFWDRLNGFTHTDAPSTLDYLAGESGAITLAALTVVAAWLAWRLPRHLPPAPAIGQTE